MPTNKNRLQWDARVSGKALAALYNRSGPDNKSSKTLGLKAPEQGHPYPRSTISRATCQASGSG
jgi:hypothetical protein